MQSDVLKIFVLGDFCIYKSFFHRLLFGDSLLSSTSNQSLDENRNLPYSPHACSYLHENNRCYTLQFWEIEDRKGLQRSDSLSNHSPDLFVVLFDVCARSSFKTTTGLLGEVNTTMPNVPQLIIACKKDLPSHTTEINDNDKVLKSEIDEVVNALGSLCVECCPVSGEGVQDAAHLMVHMAVDCQKPNKAKTCLFKKKPQMRPKHFFPESPVIDPSGNYGMANAPKCPGVNVLASRCEEDLARMKQDTSCLDVRFTFQDNPQTTPIEAHQVILISAAPELFEEIFTGQIKSKISGRHHELFEKVSWPIANTEQLSNNSPKSMVEIRVCDKVPRKQFLRLLEFLYMGASIADLQKSDSIYELLAIANTFHLPQLLEACENVLEGNAMDNIIKPSFVGGGKATVLKELFFDKPLLDDLVFQVQGSLIYAHQAVVIARSLVLAEKIAEYKRNYPDSIRAKVEIEEVTMETFKSLLEYLYTDDVKRCLDQEVLLELLGLATAYHLPRLVTLCEYLIIVNLNENSSNEKVIGIYLVAKKHNTQQLSKWCLNLIARNYTHFCTCTHYELLNNQDKQYIEHHQWPPRCNLSIENSQSIREYIANRQKDIHTKPCCVLL